MMRTLLAAMKDEYMWDYTLDGSFKFPGGVTKVMTKLFQAQMEKFPRVS